MLIFHEDEPKHSAAKMDEQVVDWCKEMIGFPASSSGSLVSGGSMANTVALIVARNVKAGVDVREQGVASIARPLRFYASDQLHSCHRKAIEAMGLGNCALQRIPTRDDLRLDLMTVAVDRCCSRLTVGRIDGDAVFHESGVG